MGEGSPFPDGEVCGSIVRAASTPRWLREGLITRRLAAGARGRRATGAVAMVAAAAATVGLAAPAMAAPAAPTGSSLSGGQAAPRSAVPWHKVGPGWALAEYSATQEGENVRHKPGASTLYLVNPQGGRYKLITWSASNP